MSIGDNIKRCRIELRMSQQDLADIMGYKTRSSIAKIESGENDITQKKLKKFAEALNTTVDELIQEKNFDSYTAKFSDPTTKRNKNIVIVLAGGNTGKNRENIPCQFLTVRGVPLIIHCLNIYQSHPLIDDIYVVCLKGWENIVTAYANQYKIAKLKDMIPAGASGMLSLKNAINHIKNKYSPEDTVIIQEATRPMIKADIVSKLLKSCQETGSATLCHSMKEYVQFNISETSHKYIDRNSAVAVQSPEAHSLSLLSKLFETAEKANHPLNESCCTMLLYNLGYKINFLENSINNIKISTEEDTAAFASFLHEL